MSTLALSIPAILESKDYVTHAFAWHAPLDRWVRDTLDAPMISVGVKINNTYAKQVANIGIENGKVRFYSGNGYTAADRTTFYSTLLQDSDENKFLIDFDRFVKGLSKDPYSEMGCLIKPISSF